MVTVSEGAIPTADDARLEKARAFVMHVQSLERGELAALKRNAGNTFAESRGVVWFYRLLDDHVMYDMEIHFLVATLIGLNKYTLTGNFGRTMAALRQTAYKKNPDGISRRFKILLDADFDLMDGKPAGGELAFRLRQLVKLAASKEVGVDWAQLLYDLRRWSQPGKYVQKAWARAFYAPGPTTE